MSNVIDFPSIEKNTKKEKPKTEPASHEKPLFYAYWEDGKMQFYFQDLNKYDLQEIKYFIEELLP